MKRRDGPRFRRIVNDLSGASLAFLIEVIIVVGLAAATFIVVAIVTAVS